jgi:hypothetical protein
MIHLPHICCEPPAHFYLGRPQSATSQAARAHYEEDALPAPGYTHNPAENAAADCRPAADAESVRNWGSVPIVRALVERFGSGRRIQLGGRSLHHTGPEAAGAAGIGRMGFASRRVGLEAGSGSFADVVAGCRVR